MQGRVEKVDYGTLDAAKARFIEASRRTLDFASAFGEVPGNALGSSANLFSLNLRPFLKSGAESISIALVPEGLGTADDARPDDLTSEELTQFWRNIGFKMLSALTNDAASSGLQTILIGLYLPSSTPATVFTDEFMSGFLDGIVDGCREVGCVYISGETPQLKNKVCPNKLDIAGSLFAILPAGVPPIDKEGVKSGNGIVFVESSGPHENGFTTLRKIAKSLPKGYRTKIGNGEEFWSAINAPSVLYTPIIQRVLQSGVPVTGVENITGHGWQKIMRSAKPLRYHIKETLPLPPVFQFLRDVKGIGIEELITIFNCGVGMTIYTKDEKSARDAVSIVRSCGRNAIVAGVVEEASEREVYVEPYNITLSGESFELQKG